jgi:hypothetical protein
VPAFVALLINHRPRRLRGRSLIEVMDVAERRSAHLAALFAAWRRGPAAIYRAPPSLVFAVLGQGRAEGRLSPEAESRLLGKLLSHWALRSTLEVSATCARLAAPPLSSHRPVPSLLAGG